MDRLKIYIERESEKNWRRYMASLSEAGNEKDFERVMTFMFEDILPENEFKDERSIYSRLTKSDKLNILSRPQQFFYKYMNYTFRKERDVDNLVVKSIIKSFQGFKQVLDGKKRECVESMKKIIYFFIELKKSERILLQDKSTDFSFMNKTVLTTKLEEPNELGEIFGRYLMSSMFGVSSVPSLFYKDIFAKVENKDFDQWHPLLKYWIFHFGIISQVFHKKCDLTSFFDTRKMNKLLKEMSILTYTKAKQEEFRKINRSSGKFGDRGQGGDRRQGQGQGRGQGGDRRPSQGQGQGQGQGRGYGQGQRPGQGYGQGQGQRPGQDPRKQFFREQGGPGGRFQGGPGGRPQQKPWQQQRGGGSDDLFKKFMSMAKKTTGKSRDGKSGGKGGKGGDSKKGQKREYSDRNPYVALYNKMLKETKVYNVYTEGAKKDDTLYNIFVESPVLKEHIDTFYRKMLFGEGDGTSKTEYCEAGPGQGSAVAPPPSTLPEESGNQNMTNNNTNNQLNNQLNNQVNNQSTVSSNAVPLMGGGFQDWKSRQGQGRGQGQGQGQGSRFSGPRPGLPVSRPMLSNPRPMRSESRTTFSRPESRSGSRKCDFKKKVPIIFAQQNPEAYFSIETELMSDKSGPKKRYGEGTNPEDIAKIMASLKEKITFYKSSYIYDDRYFAIFMKDLKRYQMNLIYLLYSLYEKKYLLYKTFSDVLDQVIKDVGTGTGNNATTNAERDGRTGNLVKAAGNNRAALNRLYNNRGNGASNRNNATANGNRTGNDHRKDILEWIMTKEFRTKNKSKNREPSNGNNQQGLITMSNQQRARYELIYEKLKKVYQYKEKVEKELFGTPQYDEERTKIDKYLQLLRREAEVEA